MKVMVIPPKRAQKYARDYLEMRPKLPKSMRAMTATGMREARKTANGEPRDAQLIVNWFARHMTYIGPALAGGETPATSKALGASWGWGHLPMYEAAKKALEKAHKERPHATKSRRKKFIVGRG